MLCEEILAIKVIVVDSMVVFGVRGYWAKITAPKAELDVLCADVPLPLVL
jgi:hypothetical protein